MSALPSKNRINISVRLNEVIEIEDQKSDKKKPDGESGLKMRTHT